MRVVSDRQAKEVSEKKRKEHELSRVKINKEDVDLIVSISLYIPNIVCRLNVMCLVYIIVSQ